MGGEMQAVGVNIIDRTCIKLRPVMPQNFLIDPVATDIESALGCAVDEFVPSRIVCPDNRFAVFTTKAKY